MSATIVSHLGESSHCISHSGIHHFEEIKAAGLPTPAVNQIEVGFSRILQGLRFLTGCSIQLHPYCQQGDIADYCRKEGIAIEAYSPLVRGNVGDDAIKDIAASKVRDVHSSRSPALSLKIELFL